MLHDEPARRCRDHAQEEHKSPWWMILIKIALFLLILYAGLWTAFSLVAYLVKYL